MRIAALVMPGFVEIWREDVNVHLVAPGYYGPIVRPKVDGVNLRLTRIEDKWLTN